MLPTQSLHRPFQDHPAAPAALVNAALDPLIAIGALAMSALVLGERLDSAYLILALIVFALTFPGRAIDPSGSVPSLFRHVVFNWLLVIGLLLLVGWVTRTLGHFDPRVIVFWSIATPLALFGAHLLVPVALPRLMAAPQMQRVAVIVGNGELGRRLAARIKGSPSLGIRVAGYFDDRSTERLGESDRVGHLGSLAQLSDFAKSHRVDLVYITLPMASQPRIRKLIEDLHDTTASIYFTPDVFLFDMIQASIDSIGDIPLVAICETPFRGINGVVKRASDLVLASAILLLIAPVMLAIAAGVKLSSAGPVLFKQRRYGLDGHEIVVYKFRSMTVSEDGGVVRQATRIDQRVTRFGAFLRRSSLDELPQFINVVQGRMSVVGPRPHAVAHNEMYRKLIRGYMIRHKVKPGITGWAQVSGLRGETDTLDKMQARIAYDLDYLRNWSLLFDLRIVAKTVRVVLKDQNAY